MVARICTLPRLWHLQLAKYPTPQAKSKLAELQVLRASLAGPWAGHNSNMCRDQSKQRYKCNCYWCQSLHFLRSARRKPGVGAHSSLGPHQWSSAESPWWGESAEAAEAVGAIGCAEPIVAQATRAVLDARLAACEWVTWQPANLWSFSIFLCLFFRCLPIYCTHLCPWYAIKTYLHILSLSCSYACVEPHSAFALLKRMPAHLWWIEEIASLEAEGNQSALQAGALSGMSHEGVACQHAIPPAQQAIAGRNLRCVGRSSCSSSEDVEISRGLREAFKEPLDFQGSVTLPVVSASLRLSQASLWHTLVAYW